MTDIGESYQSRLARERAAILAKYIPAKRQLQDSLQRKRELQTEFSIGT